MPTSNRRKGGRPRRNDELKFAYSGPFSPVLSPIRAVVTRDRAGHVTTERYTPTSAESYTVADALGAQLVGELVSLFGRQERSSGRRRGRRGGRRVTAA